MTGILLVYLFTLNQYRRLQPRNYFDTKCFKNVTYILYASRHDKLLTIHHIAKNINKVIKKTIENMYYFFLFENMY